MKSTSINNPMNFLRYNPLINISLLCGTSLLYETKNVTFEIALKYMIVFFALKYEIEIRWQYYW